MTPSLTINKQTQRRFILGKQGLFPGRRWKGKEGAAQAMREGAVVQIDPLCIVARSHDITLHSRVIDYTPELLDALCYTERRFFDYGGTVMVYPMEALPYFRAVFDRKQREPRWTRFSAENPAVIDEVLAAIREKGPLGTRDFSGPAKRASWRSGKAAGQALYYLWLSGELMTHSRRGFQRLFDLRDRIAPAEHNWAAPIDEAEHYFALRAFDSLGMASMRGWRAWFMGSIERKVSFEEASQRLQEMEEEGSIVQVTLEDDKKDPVKFIRTADFPLLEELHAGRIPALWQPLETTTEEEVTLLAPLDIVSARGRALPLFDFEYLWEVYKPREQRRWGYYTLPILHGDRLAARVDPELDRASRTLTIQGFWLETDAPKTDKFTSAICAGMRRFASFLQARKIEWNPLISSEMSERFDFRCD